MWDLDTLSYLNEQAHQRAVERANEQVQKTSQPIPTPVYPLSILAHKLLTGPPSLIALIDLFEDTEAVQEFLELVREFLPEHEADIMAGDVDGRIATFIHHFNQSYFPLSEEYDYADLTLGDFLNHIPVDLMGFTDTDYHDFSDFRQGHIVMLALVQNPFDDSEAGGRVALLEAVGELAGPGLLDIIPAEGWPAEELHRKLDGTEYEGVAHFADWVNSETDCWMLDANYESYGPEAWGRQVVDGLTRQYPKVVEIQDKIFNMSSWLEEDIRKNFRNLVFYIAEKEDLIIPKEQISLPLDENGQIM